MMDRAGTQTNPPSDPTHTQEINEHQEEIGEMESTLGEIQEREMVAIGSLKTAKKEQAKRHRHRGEIEKVCGAPIIYRDGLG